MLVVVLPTIHENSFFCAASLPLSVRWLFAEYRLREWNLARRRGGHLKFLPYQLIKSLLATRTHLSFPLWMSILRDEEGRRRRDGRQAKQGLFPLGDSLYDVHRGEEGQKILRFYSKLNQNLAERRGKGGGTVQHLVDVIYGSSLPPFPLRRMCLFSPQEGEWPVQAIWRND